MQHRKNAQTALRSFLAAWIVLFLPMSELHAQTVEYDLNIDYQTVNFTGKEIGALTINGGIPGPILTFTEGDTALIRVHNHLKTQTSIHWHGLLLPNDQDGVPYLTTYPLESGETLTFKFPLIQSGTYWYHSHTGLQEQRGVYGSIVIHPRSYSAHEQADVDAVVLMSDWTDENPMRVMRTLKRGSEWYAIKKGTVQSWDRVIVNKAVGMRLKQAWRRMPPMDISDVYYDQFLINGRQSGPLDDVKPGDRVRLRIINASASTYFHVEYAAGPMHLVAVDGLAVQPLDVDRILTGVAETYDVLVTVPATGAIEFRATAQDGSGYASLFLGEGDPVLAPDIPMPDPFNMDHMGHMNMADAAMPGEETMNDAEMDHAAMNHDEMNHAEMDHEGMNHDEMDHSMHNAPAEGCKTEMMSLDEHAGHMGMMDAGMSEDAPLVLDNDMLCALEPTTLPAENPMREVRLELTGNMERYVWAFNNKTLSSADKIMIRKGENVRFVLVNKTMMHHPLHLHGHFFRVLNGQGAYAPLKHTVDVPPMETVVIEFEANEEKDWFFHCHLLYHMMSGMSRIVSYEGSEVDPKLAAFRKMQPKKMDKKWFFWGDAAVQSQSNAGSMLFSNTRNGLGGMWHADWSGHYEVEADYKRYVNRFLTFFAGGDFDDEEELGVAGVRYVLPMNIDSELRVDHTGGVRFQAGGAIDLTARTHFAWMVNTDEEWELDLGYTLLRSLSVVGSYDSDFGAGLGVEVRY